MNKNIVILQFSARPTGNSSAISNRIKDYYTTENVQIFTIDNNIITSCGNCDYECLRPESVCPNVTSQQTRIMDTTIQADKVFFVIPNYCGFPCANYYAFNERMVGYFNLDRSKQSRYISVEKHFIIISNTEGSNFEKAVQQHVSEKPDILYLKTRQYQVNSISGDLMKSESAQKDLQNYLALLNI